MKVMQCDGCKKQITGYNGKDRYLETVLLEEGWATLILAQNECGNKWNEYSLCPECAGKMERTLRDIQKKKWEAEKAAALLNNTVRGNNEG